MKPPLRKDSFDFVYSIGVLHHTPDTRASFQSVCRLLKPGGRIAIWVYRTFQPEIQVGFHKRAFATLAQYSSDGMRAVTTRLPLPLLHQFCRLAVPIGWLQEKAYKNTVLKYALSPTLLLPFSRHRDAQVRLCDTFDWLSPRFQWKHTTAEVAHWFEAEGLSHVRPLQRAVSVTGVKTAAGDLDGGGDDPSRSESNVYAA